MIAEVELFYKLKQDKENTNNFESWEVFTFFVRNSHRDVQNFQKQIENILDEDVSITETFNKLYLTFN